MRPEAESIQAVVKLPEYLQRADKNVDLRSGYMNLVEGSSISIETTATRKLKSAHAEIVVLTQDAGLNLSPHTGRRPSYRARAEENNSTGNTASTQWQDAHQ